MTERVGRRPCSCRRHDGAAPSEWSPFAQVGTTQLDVPHHEQQQECRKRGNADGSGHSETQPVGDRSVRLPVKPQASEAAQPDRADLPNGGRCKGCDQHGGQRDAGALPVGHRRPGHVQHCLADDRHGDQLEAVQQSAGDRAGEGRGAIGECDEKERRGKCDRRLCRQRAEVPARNSPIAKPTWLLAGPGRNWQSATRSA